MPLPEPSAAPGAPGPAAEKAAPDAALGKLTPLEEVASAKAAEPSATLKIATGSLQVWAVPAAEGKKSDIIGRVRDSAKKPVGAAHLLRHTSGRVVDLALVARDGNIYLAWVSIRAGDKGKSGNALVAVLRTNLDLSAASAPVTLEHGTKINTQEDSLGDEKLGPKVRMIAPARGGVVVTYFNSNNPWVAWSFYVSPTLEPRRLGEVAADGGDGSFGGMLDLGSGVLVWTFAWSGGASWGQKFFPYVRGDKEPSLLLGDCRPPMEYYFNGTELITYCPSDYRQEGERCPIKDDSDDDDSDDLCARMFVQRLDGTNLTQSKNGATVPILKKKVVCQSGHWSRQLSWKGGSVLLDPELPGQAACKPGDRAPAFEP